MGAAGVPRIIVLRVGLLITLAVILQIGYACLQLSRAEIPISAVNDIKVIWNPFFDARKARINQIEKTIQAARARAAYSNFIVGQKDDATETMLGVREQLGIEPFSTLLWGKLVAIEADVDEQPANRLASIEVAKKLGGWNHRYYLKLAAYCLENPPVLFEHDPKLCGEMLSKLPHTNLAFNARDMGVSYNYLRSRLSELTPLYLSESSDRRGDD